MSAELKSSLKLYYTCTVLLFILGIVFLLIPSIGYKNEVELIDQKFRVNISALDILMRNYKQSVFVEGDKQGEFLVNILELFFANPDTDIDSPEINFLIQSFSEDLRFMLIMILCIMLIAFLCTAISAIYNKKGNVRSLFVTKHSRLPDLPIHFVWLVNIFSVGSLLIAKYTQTKFENLYIPLGGIAVLIVTFAIRFIRDRIWNKKIEPNLIAAPASFNN